MKRILVALALLLAASIAPASLRRTVLRQNHAHRVMCYTSCPFYRDRCQNVFVKGCLYKRCVKEMVYSCLGNPADAQCARPCSQLNPCAAGQQCAQGQCIMQTPAVKCAQLPPLKRPKPPTTEACGTIFCPQGTPYCDHGTSTCVANPPLECPATYPVACQNGICCPSGATCNTSGCCGGQYPVPCGDYCCTPGSICGQGGCADPCPAATPVACGNPLVCCAASTVCGRDCNTTTTTLPGPSLPPGNYNVTICVSGTISLPCTPIGTFPVSQLGAFEQAMQGAISQFLSSGGAQGCSIGAGQASAAGGGVDVRFSATCTDPSGASASETVLLKVRP
jgi:hypothetical protein